MITTRRPHQRNHVAWTLHRLNHYHYHSPDLFEQLSLCTLDGIGMIDAAGRLRQVNDSLVEMLRAPSREALLNKRFRDYVQAEYRETYDSLIELAQYQSTPTPSYEIVLIDHEAIELYTSLYMFRTRSHPREAIQFVVRNLSDWKLVQDQLVRANLELEHAYQSTLYGWGKALELRDYETKGHTHRVTEKTVDLALHMGVHLEEIVHLRHGAMLHDIGKMAIADDILQKPGPLTSEEWTQMRLHPVYAYELLLPIEYLRPAIDIPYCHHERWDGCGYPRGLRQEEIPLAARIFSVVDVWDALCSDRPYRKAWPEERAIEYICDNAGIQFDPQVVTRFLETI